MRRRDRALETCPYMVVSARCLVMQCGTCTCWSASGAERDPDVDVGGQGTALADGVAREIERRSDRLAGPTESRAGLDRRLGLAPPGVADVDATPATCLQPIGGLLRETGGGRGVQHLDGRAGRRQEC